MRPVKRGGVRKTFHSIERDTDGHLFAAMWAMRCRFDLSAQKVEEESAGQPDGHFVPREESCRGDEEGIQRIERRVPMGIRESICLQEHKRPNLIRIL